MLKDNLTQGKMNTVLATWMRAATPAQRDLLAKGANTSVAYLRFLAGVHRENPKIRLALAIVKTANAVLPDRVTGVPLPIITLEDLAKPTRHPGRD